MKSKRRQEEAIRRLLLQNRPPDVDPERRRQLVRQVTSLMEQRPPVPLKTSYIQKLWEQVRYISPLTWCLQFLAVPFLVLFVNWNHGDVMQILLICSPLAGIIGICEVLRSFSCHMGELEQTCRYNLRQVLAMKLWLMGLADLLILCFAGAVAGAAGGKLSEMILYVVIPFNLSNSLYLFLLNKVSRRFSGSILLGCGIFLSFLLAFLRENSPFLLRWQASEIAAPLLLLMFLASFALILWMGSRFIKNTPMEEMIWN